MKVILYGIQSCASKYNCSFGLCYRNEEGVWVKGPNRTIDSLYKDNARWKAETNENLKDLKNYNSAKNQPIMARSHKLVLLQAPPTPLHDLHIGPVNHILENLGDDLEHFLAKQGITREKFFISWKVMKQ